MIQPDLSLGQPGGTEPPGSDGYVKPKEESNEEKHEEEDWRRNDLSGLYGGRHGDRHWWYDVELGGSRTYEEKPEIATDLKDPEKAKPAPKHSGRPIVAIVRVKDEPGKTPPGSTSNTPRQQGVPPDVTPPDGNITPIWYRKYNNQNGNLGPQEAWKRKCSQNDTLVKTPTGSFAPRILGTKKNPKCQVCRRQIFLNQTITP